MSKGSRGILEGLSLNSKESKKETSQEVKNVEIEELTIKRSYTLKPSTVKKLQELKIFIYDDPSITFNEIVDEAICMLYESNKEKIK